MNQRLRPLPLLSSSCLALALVATNPSPIAAAQYKFTNIVDSTMKAANGQEWDDGIWDTAVNGSNVLVQRNQGGIYVWANGSLTKIVETGDPGPTGTFFDFGRTSTLATDSNSAAFIGIDGGMGIFTGSGGALSSIVKSGDAAPSGQFTSFRLQNYMTGGVVPFYGEYAGGSGIFSGSGGPLSTIIKTGDPAPSGVFSQIDRFGVLGDSTAFTATDAAGRGLFLRSSVGLTTIARIGGPAPTGVFDNIAAEARTIAVSGDKVAFYGHYGLFPADGNGIFVGDGGAITTIAKKGDPAPSGVFTAFDASGLAMAGNVVVFSASYTNGSGVFTSEGGPLTKVIATGDSLFGQVVQSTYYTSLDPGGSGAVVINYVLANGVFGVALATPVPEPNISTLLGIAIAGVSILRAGRSRGLETAAENLRSPSQHLAASSRAGH